MLTMVIRIISIILFCLLQISISAQEYGSPSPNAPAEIEDWKELIGKCKCQSVSRNNDGTWQDTTQMEWIFQYIMDGLAVQDITYKADGKHSMSIRQYHPDSAAWYVTYFSGTAPSSKPGTWKGNRQGDKIILYMDQKAPNGQQGMYKITFSDISDQGYNWLGEWVNMDETFSYPTWKIYCKKEKND